MGQELLPSNGTAWERVVADAMDATADLAGAVGAIRTAKLISPPPSFLPFLVYEYGLGELTPYVPNLYDLINEGVDWQRVRGTPASLFMALGWLGYGGDLREENTRRRFWNLFQIELDRVRDNEAGLEGVAGIARLSVPQRSVFWRGYHGLDIRPQTFGESHLGDSHFGEYSGRRLKQGGPLWSFGRAYEYDLTVTRAFLEPLGVWIEPLDRSVDRFGIGALWFEGPRVSFREDVSAEPDLGWDDITWDGTEGSWISTGDLARSEGMASAFRGRATWFAFHDAGGDVIGYRRARASHFVEGSQRPVYSVNGLGYRVASSVTTNLYVECQTDFGDGDGMNATDFSLVLDGQPAAGLPRGSRWLGPDQLVGGTAPTPRQPIAIEFGKTVRERVKLLLRF